MCVCTRVSRQNTCTVQLAREINVHVVICRSKLWAFPSYDHPLVLGCLDKGSCTVYITCTCTCIYMYINQYIHVHDHGQKVYIWDI